jgi:hypothetical protein
MIYAATGQVVGKGKVIIAVGQFPEIVAAEHTLPSIVQYRPYMGIEFYDSLHTAQAHNLEHVDVLGPLLAEANDAAIDQL